MLKRLIACLLWAYRKHRAWLSEISNRPSDCKSWNDISEQEKFFEEAERASENSKFTLKKFVKYPT